MKKTITAVAAVVALSASLAVAAPGDGFHRGHGKQGKGRMMMMGRMAEKLNLTDAQKQQMKALHETFRTENAALFDAVKATKTQLREARKANDVARAQTLAATLEGQTAQLRTKRVAQHEKMLSILTPEQRAQLETWKADREERREKRGPGRGQGEGPGQGHGRMH